MTNTYFKFKQFTILQDKSAFKVGTDSVLLGACAWLSAAKRILDVGTGTGLLAIMAAQRTDAEIIAIEPETGSFEQASQNINLCKWSERISLINCAFKSYYLTQNSRFDVIITNPPYFRNSLKNPDSVKSSTRHSVYLSSSEIIEGAKRLLEDEGSLQLILPFVEGNLFIQEAQKSGFYCTQSISVRPVPSGEIRRLILKFGRTKKPLSEQFLTIETGIRHSFTEEYKDKTRDFYLNF